MFGRKKKLVEPTPPTLSGPVAWPEGSFVTSESGSYFIKAGKRYRVYSRRVLDSWSANAIPVKEENLLHLKRAGTLGFRDSTLIKDLSDGKIYLIAGSKRRHVTNPDWLKIFRQEPVLVSHDEAMLHEEGEELNGLDTTSVTVKR